METVKLSQTEKIFQHNGKMQIDQFNIMDFDKNILTGPVTVEDGRLYTSSSHTATVLSVKLGLKKQVDDPTGEKSGYWLFKA